MNEFLSKLSFSPSYVEKLGSIHKKLDRESTFLAASVVFSATNVVVILLAAGRQNELTAQEINRGDNALAYWLYEAVTRISSIDTSFALSISIVAVVFCSYFFSRTKLLIKEVEILKKISRQKRVDRS